MSSKLNHETTGSAGLVSAGKESGPADIRARAFAYALRAIKLFQHLEKRGGGAGRILGRQYLSAATSVGANIEEAPSAESRADFIHKCGVAQKEVREALYWLRLLAESEIMPPDRLKPLIQETGVIISIISSIIIHSKRMRAA